MLEWRSTVEPNPAINSLDVWGRGLPGHRDDRALQRNSRLFAGGDACRARLGHSVGAFLNQVPGPFLSRECLIAQHCLGG